MVYSSNRVKFAKAPRFTVTAARLACDATTSELRPPGVARPMCS